MFLKIYNTKLQYVTAILAENLISLKFKCISVFNYSKMKYQVGFGLSSGNIHKKCVTPTSPHKISL